MINRIGFMQGRLCDLVEGKIQAFPWLQWRDEFAIAEEIGLQLMEWTLDQDRLYDNPIMTNFGVVEIADLCSRHNVAIKSLTGDCFMQAPFWKACNSVASSLKRDFLAVCEACSKAGITFVVVPLVDNGRLETRIQEDELIGYLLSISDSLRGLKVKIAFEIDFDPIEVARFISRLPSDVFGINYDIGNSAAIGLNVAEEMQAYGSRICNVHIKDRVLGGGTVPLLSGDADFAQVFSALYELNYSGNYILQTARAANNDHRGDLSNYFELTNRWLTEYA